MRKAFFQALMRRPWLLKPVESTAQLMLWSCASQRTKRWVGQGWCFVLRLIFREKIYLLLHVARYYRQQQYNSFELDDFFIGRWLTNTTDVLSEYQRVLRQLRLTPTEQLDWAQCFIAMNRRDISLIIYQCLLEQVKVVDIRATTPEMSTLTRDTPTPRSDAPTFRGLSAESIQIEHLIVQHHCYYWMGYLYFFFGNHRQAHECAQQLGEVRRALCLSSTPRHYRILGKSWFGSIGHIGELDFYLKEKRLYQTAPLRIVAEWPDERLPGSELFATMAQQEGVVILSPGTLEQDYNAWATENGFACWEALTAAEKLTMTDDYWYQSVGDTFLLHAHACAKVTHDWGDKPPLFALTEDDQAWRAAYLSQWGMTADDWYVCLHVREAGYAIHQTHDQLFPSTRNAKIETYLPAIEAVVQAGGWVIRMGDPSMTPLPTMTSVIDYAHSAVRSPRADRVISAGARFVIGTISGYLAFPSIYHVPCLLTNVATFGAPTWARQDLLVTKQFRDEKNDRLLTLQELFEQGLTSLHYLADLPAGITLIDNSESLLLKATQEALSAEWKGASPGTQQAYEQLAKAHGFYTGPRLAQSGVEAHAEMFV